jgi:hypothetical protein
VLRDKKWVRSAGSGKELGSELYGAMVGLLRKSDVFRNDVDLDALIATILTNP